MIPRAWWGLVFVLGCTNEASVTEPLGRPDAAVPVACADTEGILGSGVRSFLPVVDGDTVYLYRGPQGGYMVYLSVRAKGLDPSEVKVCYTDTFADGETFGSGCWRVRLGNDLGNGWHERVGIWGQIDTRFWTTPAVVRGQDASISVTMTDLEGCEVSDGFAVHISSTPGR